MRRGDPCGRPGGEKPVLSGWSITFPSPLEGEGGVRGYREGGKDGN